MRLFQILSFGTELVDELFFFLIMKPVYMCLCGWFLSFPMHPSFHGYFLTTLFSSLISSLLYLSNFLWSPTAVSLYLLISFASYHYPFMNFLSFSSLPFIHLSLSHVSLVVSFLSSLHPFFPHVFAHCFPSSIIIWPSLYFLPNFLFLYLLYSFATYLLSSTLHPSINVFKPLIPYQDPPFHHHCLFCCILNVALFLLILILPFLTLPIPLFTDCSLEHIFIPLILSPFIINVPFPNVTTPFRNGFIFHVLTETETLI